MPAINDKPWRDIKPDAQAFDEIRIYTKPRYKTSSLSGDEWRISAAVQFMRKGKLIHETSFSNIETACKYLAVEHNTAIEQGKAFFAGEDDLCDQEGCAEKATVVYRKKFDYCDHGHKHEITVAKSKIRCFCARHSRRGDCGLDDADDNYEIMEGSIEQPKEEDVRKSVLGGVVTIKESSDE